MLLRRTPRDESPVALPDPLPGQLLSIQALRGIAAILVTVFHAGLHFDPSESTFRIGNAGVDIFFVISGFVMWTVVCRRPTTPGSFLVHRAVRLIPLYWVFTLLLVVLALAAPPEVPRLHLSLRHIVLSLAFIPHNAPASGRIGPVLGQGWTLNFEMFFYCLFAAALALPVSRRLLGISTALVAMTGLGFLIATPAVPVSSLLSPLLIEFLFGLWLARLFIAGVRPPAAVSSTATALGIFLLLLAAPGASNNLARLMQYGFPATLIVGGMVGLEIAGRLPVPRLLIVLGDASYSIYLSHTFIISVLGKIWPSHFPAVAFIAAASLVATAGGVVVYFLIERPLLNRMRRLMRRHSRKAEPAALEIRPA